MQVLSDFEGVVDGVAGQFTGEVAVARALLDGAAPALSVHPNPLRTAVRLGQPSGQLPMTGPAMVGKPIVRASTAVMTTDKALVVYASERGSTRQIAEFVAAELVGARRCRARKRRSRLVMVEWCAVN